MSLHNDYFDKIEAYLFGQMSPADREAFEQELEKNEDLAGELALHQLEHRSMELLAQQALQNNLNSWKKEKEMEATTDIKQEAKVVSFSQRRRFFQIAAAAAVLLIAGFFIWNWQSDSIDNQAIASQLFESTSSSSRSNGTGNVPPELAPGLNALWEKDYAAAISYFDAVKDSSYLEQAMLLKGEALFQQKHFAQAAAVYQQIISESKDQLVLQEAEWHLLLAWLAADQKTVAFNSLLNRISNNAGHSYQLQAIKLRKEMGD